MLRMSRFVFMALALNMAFCIGLWALERSDPDYLDKLQIARIVAKLRSSFQNQDPEQVSRYFVSFADLQEARASSTMDSSQTSTTTRTKTSIEEDVESEFGKLFSAFEGREVFKPAESFSNTWDIDVIQEGLEFSEDKNEAWVDLLVGSGLMQEDSTYLQKLDASSLSKMTAKRRKDLLKYWPIRLHLKKEYNAWRVASFDELREYMESTSTIQERIKAEENRN